MILLTFVFLSFAVRRGWSALQPCDNRGQCGTSATAQISICAPISVPRPMPCTSTTLPSPPTTSRIQRKKSLLPSTSPAPHPIYARDRRGSSRTNARNVKINFCTFERQKAYETHIIIATIITNIYSRPYSLSIYLAVVRGPSHFLLVTLLLATPVINSEPDITTGIA